MVSDWLERLQRSRGATSLEYALLASLIAAVIAAVVGVLGTQILDLFNTVIGRF